ncbi:uncharacterized protein LOC127264178 [Andrographis paniculata]|uniref:uncharacterized protein LOC127264178 n=1 Tax=Andrographis paniculata TaxID=175694 RepID=UPI0021E78F2F|nr:uncharacterized protein LOC127264178 [Andrographis paniculata]
MATGAAGDAFLRGIFEGCISGGDMGVQRRPYHRNCGCALHDSRGRCPHESRSNSVSYPIRRSWSETCLAVIGQSPSPSCSTSPSAAADIRRTSSQQLLCKSTEEEEDAA